MTSLQPLYDKYAREIEMILQNQVPKKTGNLARSIIVTADEDGIHVHIGNEQIAYGIYTQAGTNQYYDKEAFDSVFAGKWNPNPGKGERGIIPRYWENFGSVIKDQMLDEVAAQIQLTIINYITAK